MKVGIQLPEVEWEVPFPELIAMAQLAEAVGFDSLWLGDHLLYELQVGPRGPWEVWTSLAAIAATTTTIEIGPLVACTSFHSPAMLAKQAATIDAISGGRLILGLGAGWNRPDYRAFGFPYDRRVGRFAEAFTIIRTLLADGSIDFHGEFYDADQCTLHPMSPREGGPPLMIGSIGDRMLDITLPYVSAWNMWWSQYGNTAGGFAREKARVDRLIEAAGRSVGDVDATAAVYVQLAGGTRRQMGDYDAETSVEPLTGTADELVDHLRSFEAAGCAHVQLVVDPITRDSIEHLADVLTKFRGGAFVPTGFEPPVPPRAARFWLEPLGPQHNEADYAAWTSSMDHILSTPGFVDGDWPHLMTIDENLGDLVRHARDFDRRAGFTYTVRSTTDDDVIGCVYIYPAADDRTIATVESWVRASHAELDEELVEIVATWLASNWPFTAIRYR